jgi:hypothetical protein
MFFDGYRPYLNKFVPVVVIRPMSSMTVPIAGVVIMPVSVIPVVIATVFISFQRKRSSDNRSEDAYSKE